MTARFATHHVTPIDTPSPPAGGTVTRADRTVLPVRVSGFGAVMEKEHDLKLATQDCLRGVGRRRDSGLVGLLLNHQVRLQANLTLLGQRYQMLPRPERFDALRPLLSAPAGTPVALARPEACSLLPRLLALHRRLLEETESLLAQQRDGQRGELILAQVARNHEEMAAMIEAALAGEPLGDSATLPAAASSSVPRPAEAARENEGGSLSVRPPAR